MLAHPLPRVGLIVLLLCGVVVLGATVESDYSPQQLCKAVSIELAPPPNPPQPRTVTDDVSVILHSLIPLKPQQACVGLFLVGTGRSGNTLPAGFTADSPFYVEFFDPAKTGSSFGGQFKLKSALYYIVRNTLTGQFRIQAKVATSSSTLDSAMCTMTERSAQELPANYQGPAWTTDVVSAVSPKNYVYNGVNALTVTAPQDVLEGQPIVSSAQALGALTINGLLDAVGIDGWVGVFASNSPNFNDPAGALVRKDIALKQQMTVGVITDLALDAAALRTTLTSASAPFHFELRAYTKTNTLLANMVLGNTADAVVTIQNEQPLHSNAPLLARVAVNADKLNPRLLSNAGTSLLRVALKRQAGGACTAQTVSVKDLNYPPADHEPVQLGAPGMGTCSYMLSLSVLQWKAQNADTSSAPDQTTEVATQTVDVVGEAVSLRLFGSKSLARNRPFVLNVSLHAAAPLPSDRIALFDKDGAGATLLSSYYPSSMGLGAGSSTNLTLQAKFPPSVDTVYIKYLTVGESSSPACSVSASIVDGGLCDSTCGARAGAECLSDSECGTCSAAKPCQQRPGFCSTHCKKPNVPCSPSAMSAPTECGSCAVTMAAADTCINPNKPGRCASTCSNARLSCTPSTTAVPTECGSCGGLAPADACINPDKPGRCASTCSNAGAACSPSPTRSPLECGSCSNTKAADTCVDPRKPPGRCSARCDKPHAACMPSTTAAPLECGFCEVSSPAESCVRPEDKPGKCATNCKFPDEPCSPSATGSPAECGGCSNDVKEPCVVPTKPGKCAAQCSKPGVPCSPSTVAVPTECGSCSTNIVDSCQPDLPGKCSAKCANAGRNCMPSSSEVPAECGNCGVTPAQSCVLPSPPPKVPPFPPPCIEMRDRNGKQMVPTSGEAGATTAEYTVEANKDEWLALQAILNNPECKQKMSAQSTSSSLETKVDWYDQSQPKFDVVAIPHVDNKIERMIMAVCGCTTELLIRVRGPACINYGDPHITTWDGTGIMFQGVGDFDLIKPKSNSDYNVQIRLAPSSKLTAQSGKVVEVPENTGDRVITTPKGVAVRDNGVQVAVYTYNYLTSQGAPKASLFVVATDGTRTNKIDVRKMTVPKTPLLGDTMELGWVQLADGTHLQYDQIYVTTSSGTQVNIGNYDSGGTAASVSVRTPAGYTETRGLCGTMNGNPNDDLTAQNDPNTLIKNSDQASTIFNAAMTWRVSDQARSLFSYSGTMPSGHHSPQLQSLAHAHHTALFGGSANTQVYGDDVPDDLTALPAFDQVNKDGVKPVLAAPAFSDPVLQQKAEQTCGLIKTAQVASSTSQFYDDCLFDVKVTNNLAFAQAALSAQTQLCTAKKGSNDPSCQVAECDASSCQNGGVCAVKANTPSGDGATSSPSATTYTYGCSCTADYAGQYCEIPLKGAASVTLATIMLSIGLTVALIAIIVGAFLAGRAYLHKQKSRATTDKLSRIELHSSGGGKHSPVNSTNSDYLARPSNSTTRAQGATSL